MLSFVHRSNKGDPRTSTGRPPSFFPLGTVTYKHFRNAHYATGSRATLERNAHGLQSRSSVPLTHLSQTRKAHYAKLTRVRIIWGLFASQLRITRDLCILQSYNIHEEVSRHSVSQFSKLMLLLFVFWGGSTEIPSRELNFVQTKLESEA